MLTYSIAIRTLGTAGEKFLAELRSIECQTVQPEKVMVYIAEGYSRPGFTVGKEEYVWVKKGMMSQRVLPYDEITSDCVLMLDDDVCLAPDSAAKLLQAMEENGADCVGPDVFKNQEMPFRMKVKAVVSDLVFPHFSGKWAYKVRCDGSFSYNHRPEPRYYLSQSCAGPAQLWKKQSFKDLRLEDELWLDSLAFPFAEDRLMTYKLHFNGGRLGVLYDSGVKNLDAGSSSSSFKKSPDRIRVRTVASYMTWWRMCYRYGGDTSGSRFAASFAFGFKSLWLLLVMTVLAIVRLDFKVLTSYIKGWMEGRNRCRSGFFDGLAPYRLVSVPGRNKKFFLKSRRRAAAEMMRIKPRNKADAGAFVKFRSLIPELALYDQRNAKRQLRLNALDKGFETLGQYYDFVESHPDELAVLRESITYLGTVFFRGKAWPEFQEICQELIPLSGDGKVRVWCAGCSSGKEAYSVLMVLLDLIPAHRIELLATDYNHALLERCKEAIYPLSTIEDIPVKYWRHVEKHIPESFQVRKELRDIVRTGALDLLKDGYPSGFDIILCRNVMKFFEPGAKSQVQRKLAESLNPGGILFVSDELEKEGIPDPEKMGLCQIGNYPLYRKR